MEHGLVFWVHDLVAGAGLEPATSGLWALRAAAAPPRDIGSIMR